MDKSIWIEELVEAEKQMEESGMVDFSAGFDPDRTLIEETVQFLRDLKLGFIESASTFNKLKNSPANNLKIYGISKTQADFMLFRNSYKLIFTFRQPGVIAITLNHINHQMVPQQEAGDDANEDLLAAEWGAFGELKWKYKDYPVNLDYVVRYYMVRFVRESAK